MVYHWEYCGNIATGTKVYESPERESARRECFRLNGWSYNEPVSPKLVIYKSNFSWDNMSDWLKFVIITNINPRLNTPVTDESGILNEMRDEIAESIRKQRVRVPVMVEVREDEGMKVLFVKRSGRVLISIYVKSNIIPDYG